MKTSDTRKR